MWTKTQEDRWTLEGDDQHVLLKDGTRYVEFTGTTVHVYAGPEEVASDDWPLGDPAETEAATRWLRTEEREDLAEAPNDERWSTLAEQRYTDPDLESQWP
jgi:hypothetical protein